MKLYFQYMSIHFRSQLQYRMSFFLLSIGQFFIPFFVFAGMYFMFERFGQLQGWSFFEVALCYAVIHLSFSLSESLARGFDAFSGLVVAGGFDRLLVRPRNTVLQVLGSKFEFTRIGRLLQSIIVLIWSLSNLPQVWSLPKLLTLSFMVLNGVFIFTGIFMLAATLCFWTVQGLEVANVFTDGGREMAQYPLHIYERPVFKFFTFIIPFGCVTYYPLLYLLDKEEGSLLLGILTPLGGALFLLPCLLVWRAGVKHYHSTGS
ncbi:ABC-2 family transporter protein [Paenibacillus sp. J5C_2022]|uniref:ABC transporter permease n=1 Tax=Paenibacillus sp. J5C2022 TaxID=2977129 RepID=UPI0021D0A6FF|nr:ABC-2 family transporter protein [Paenibacillus sp. J5C2022]MCU6710351.1 ABC-2 family transporter protein [Paenibacillus sp. J5C2022]